MFLDSSLRCTAHILHDTDGITVQCSSEPHSGQHSLYHILCETCEVLGEELQVSACTHRQTDRCRLSFTHCAAQRGWTIVKPDCSPSWTSHYVNHHMNTWTAYSTSTSLGHYRRHWQEIYNWVAGAV